MKNNKKGFIVPLLIAIIALLIIGGGAYVYIYIQQKANTQPSDEKIDCGAMNLPPDCNSGAKEVAPGIQKNVVGINQTQQTTPATQVSNSQIANWKTYTNDKYGFEFKYPINVTFMKEEIASVFSMLIRGTNDFGLTPTMDITVTDLKYSKYKDFSTYSKNTENSLTQCVSKKICKLTYFTVGGLPALQIERSTRTQLSKEVTSFNGNFMYSIRGETLRNGFSFQQLLSTFKFTK